MGMVLMPRILPKLPRPKYSPRMEVVSGLRPPKPRPKITAKV